jgi:uncharacterized protein (TIGR02246 family)
MRATSLVLATTFALTCAVASGASDDVDMAAIHMRAAAYVDAYNQQDAAALSELWADDAVYLNRDTGEPIEGRAAIGEMFKSMFESGEASQLSVTIQSVRLITPDVAIEDGTAEIRSGAGEMTTSTYTATHVKKEGVWYLNSVRETDMPAPPSREPGELDQLSWLIGEWVDEADDAAVHTNCQWVKNGHFLACNFSVNVKDRVELEGTQVIGWDASTGQIRSWIFDSEGGVGDGVWRRVGNEWIVETKSTLSDGSKGSATNIYTPIDENTYTWKSVDRQIDGQTQAEIDEVRVHRQIAVAANVAMPTQSLDGGN